MDSSQSRQVKPPSVYPYLRYIASVSVLWTECDAEIAGCIVKDGCMEVDGNCMDGGAGGWTENGGSCMDGSAGGCMENVGNRMDGGTGGWTDNGGDQ